jgi:hypothetical protein
MNKKQKLLVDRFLQRSDVKYDEAVDFFKNTKLAMSFVEVLFDNIKYTHKNLPYFVSTQIPHNDTPTLYRSIRNNLIIPVLKKYQYYSPTIIFELVTRICKYVDIYYGNQNAYSMDNLIDIVQAQKIRYSDILEDIELWKLEQSVWATQCTYSGGAGDRTCD